MKKATTRSINSSDGSVNSLIDGGDGNDSLTDSSGEDSIGGGDDTIDGGTIFGGSGANTIKAGDGDDSVNVGSSGDSVEAGLGDDMVSGFGGADTVWAFGGDDIGGGNGNDGLDGDNQDDEPFGGQGMDTMYGGLDADVFVYTNINQTGATAMTQARIMDFRADQDVIDLWALPGNLELTGTTGFTALGPGNGQVRLSGPNQWVAIDVDGDGSVDGTIFVGPVAGITADNFIL